MISVCYISRNRDQNLANSLKTMNDQTVRPSRIVVCDCSDNESTMIPVVNDFKKYSDIPIKFVWKPAEELTRSQGRQLGRAYVDTELMASTEADILYPSNLIEETLKVFRNPPKKLYVQPWIQAYGENGELGPIFKEHRSGFFQCFRTCDCDAVGGYNTLLSGWGWDDTCLRNRLEKYGCLIVTIPIIVHHQWHPKIASNEENSRNQFIDANSYFDRKTQTWRLNDGIEL